MTEPKPIPKPTVGKQGQEITYYLENGVEMRKYVQSGVIQRWNGSKWVFAPGTAREIIDSQRASEIATKGWDEWREAKLQGLMDATGKRVPAEAVRELSRVYAEHSLAGGKGGASYGKLVHDSLPGVLSPDRNVISEELPPGTVRLSLTGTVQDVRKALMSKYQKDDGFDNSSYSKHGEDVIDVTPTEPDSD